VYAKCQLEGSERPVNEILVICHKNGTVILLQCSKLSHPVRDIDASVGCEDRLTWIHGALGAESKVRRVLWRHVIQSIIVGGEFGRVFHLSNRLCSGQNFIIQHSGRDHRVDRQPTPEEISRQLCTLCCNQICATQALLRGGISPTKMPRNCSRLI
jgi:hypothetical protein